MCLMKVNTCKIYQQTSSRVFVIKTTCKLFDHHLPIKCVCVLWVLTIVSTILVLLFLSVLTVWKTSTMFCCWIISLMLQMAQNVPERPPPVLRRRKQEERRREDTRYSSLNNKPRYVSQNYHADHASRRKRKK